MHRPFRFGVVGGNVGPSSTAWIAQARHAEELGYSTLLLPDTLRMDFAPLTALMAAAAATTSLHVGSYVFANDYRHPAVLAREAATLHLLSAGRFELGLGAGVGPSDYIQMGLPFESAGIRVSRFEESLGIIQRLFTEENVSFSGKYYTLSNMKGFPRPTPPTHLPILVASGSKRMLSFAARHADIVAIALKINAQGADPADAPLAEKVAWVRTAAGERFADLELAQTAYTLAITDSVSSVVAPPAWMKFPLMQLTYLNVEQAVEHLLEQRERYGFSYIQVSGMQMENFAPVVARLASK